MAMQVFPPPAFSAESIVGRFEPEAQRIVEEAKIAPAIVQASPRSFANTIGALSDLHAQFANAGYCLTFPALVSTSKPVRDAATRAKGLLEESDIELYSREDLYLALKECKEKGLAQDEEERRVLEKFLSDFERNGLALPADRRSALTALKKKIGELCTQFNRNVNETKLSATFSEAALDGLSADYLASLPKTDDGNYVVSTLYPELFPLLQRAKVEETRKKMEFLANTKCQGTNTQILKQVLALRQEAAALLGCANDAEVQLSVKMARDADTVNRFLHDISAGLEGLAKREYAALLELKRAECEERKTAFDGRLNSWDLRYYQNRILEMHYQVDDQLVQQYFPLDVVLRGVCTIYQQILGLSFSKIEKPGSIWHEDVQAFAVQDAASSSFLGYFYLDLFPREGKYSHAACYPLQLAHTDPAGRRHFTESALVCNFTKPLPTKPALLKHSEVKTLFHEFGHLMHSILSRSRFSRLCWTWSAVEQDFLEVPSMMFENWVWEKSVLRSISAKHPSGEPLPDELMDRMIKARHADAGIYWRRLVFMSQVDLQLHTEPAKHPDTAALYSALMKEQIFAEMQPGTDPVASWQHLTTGYNAGYYGYLWSLVYACDLYTRFQAAGILDPATGAALRRVVLEPVAIHSGMQMLEGFLGRKPDPKAFLRSVGALP